MSLRDDLNYSLAAFGVQLPDSVDIDALAAKLGDRPARNTIAMVVTAAVLFYMAERGRNPKVRDMYDALVYCSTEMSVGYADIFARTPVGKLIGTALMTFGPAMSGKALDGPKPPADDTQQQILTTLQAILARLDAPAQHAQADPVR